MTGYTSFRYGNKAVECDHAQMTVVCRQLATVVSVGGRIDRDNVDRSIAFATRYVLTEKPFVLDLEDVDEVTDEDTAVFHAVDSVPDALHRFADATAARRRLVPILTKSA